MIYFYDLLVQTVMVLPSRIVTRLREKAFAMGKGSQLSNGVLNPSGYSETEGQKQTSARNNKGVP